MASNSNSFGSEFVRINVVYNHLVIPQRDGNPFKWKEIPSILSETYRHTERLDVPDSMIINISRGSFSCKVQVQIIYLLQCPLYPISDHANLLTRIRAGTVTNVTMLG